MGCCLKLILSPGPALPLLCRPLEFVLGATKGIYNFLVATAENVRRSKWNDFSRTFFV